MMIAKKSFIKILLLFILVFSLNLAIPAKTAYAQNVDPVQSVLQGAKWVWERVEQAYSKISGVIGNKVVESTVRMYTNQLAYNIATGIAQGAEDGGPLFRTSSVKKSLETAREAALGEFVTRLTTENFADLGFNLCDPSIEVKLTLTLNLIDSSLFLMT